MVAEVLILRIQRKVDKFLRIQVAIAVFEKQLREGVFERADMSFHDSELSICLSTAHNDPDPTAR